MASARQERGVFAQCAPAPRRRENRASLAGVGFESGEIVMKRLLLIAGLSLAAGAASLSAASAGPAGVWRVEDGTANVEIAPCGNALCGAVTWLSKPDLKDSKNPDISKRGRPV